MSRGSDQRRKLVAAWADLCDSLKARAEELLEGSRGVITDQQFAEGIRHLGRLAVHGLQSRVEFRDTDFPGFACATTATAGARPMPTRIT